MDSSSHARPRFSEDPGASFPEYRTLSALAVAGLVSGLASVVVLAEPDAWFLPLLGIAVSAMAIRRIARSDARLTGRWLAMAGLALSVTMGAAAPADRLCYDWLIRREAEQFGYRWFEFLRHYQPDRAFELTKHPQIRLPPASNSNTKDPQRQRELESYIANPVVQKLLTLGGKAEVRYERTTSQKRTPNFDVVTPVYSVACEQTGRSETLHVALTLLRLRLVRPDPSGAKTPVAQWQVHHAEEMPDRP